MFKIDSDGLKQIDRRRSRCINFTHKISWVFKVVESGNDSNENRKNIIIIKNIFPNYLIIIISFFLCTWCVFAIRSESDALWHQNVQPPIITTKCKRITSCTVVYLMMMNIVIVQKCSFDCVQQSKARLDTHVCKQANGCDFDFDCVHLWRVSISVIAIDPLLLLLHKTLPFSTPTSFRSVQIAVRKSLFSFSLAASVNEIALLRADIEILSKILLKFSSFEEQLTAQWWWRARSVGRCSDKLPVLFEISSADSAITAASGFMCSQRGVHVHCFPPASSAVSLMCKPPIWRSLMTIFLFNCPIISKRSAAN